MAAEVLLPRLGWSMEIGSLAEWVKHDGDSVKVGDIICMVEGDKAVNEVESFDSGILRIPPTSPPLGEKVPVGTLLAYIVQPGEPAPFEAGGRQPAPPAAAQAVTSNAGSGSTAVAVPMSTNRGTGAVSAPAEERTISPRARRVATELKVDWATLEGSGRTGRIVERDVRRAAAAQVVADTVETGARISPLVRRVADEAGVDLEELARSKPGQRITRADVEAAARAVPESVAPEAKRLPQPAAATTEQREPLSGIRQIIASRLAESAHTVAPVTLTTEADASDLVRLRAQIKSDLAGTNLPVPSYNDLLAKLVAIALGEHPRLNSSLIDGAIVQHTAVNIGIAVDTERGLIVPVVRDVQDRSVQSIASESARLIVAVRDSRVSPDDLRDGTFTITNLGMYDIDAFTPIINLPECAILGVGRIVPRPVVVDEETERVAVRKMLALSLTFDHRIVDGAPAARFLQRVKHFVEHPTLGLIR